MENAQSEKDKLVESSVIGVTDMEDAKEHLVADMQENQNRSSTMAEPISDSDADDSFPEFGDFVAEHIMKAACVMQGEKGVLGTVFFNQASATGPTKIYADIKGLAPGLHGFHISEWGDNTKGCESAGFHFNPYGKCHGGPLDKTRHVGDLGNVEADSSGVAKLEITDPMISLNGPYSVVGRTLELTEKEDDLGKGGDSESLKTGNAGGRVAYGVIGLSSP